jgi:uncharacterized membrane protein YidH (DUF202 family)
VSADDSARMRDLLASNRTMLAWIRTALSFAGLGFVVAKFGRTPGMIRWPAVMAAACCALACALLAAYLVVST